MPAVSSVRCSATMRMMNHTGCSSSIVARGAKANPLPPESHSLNVGLGSQLNADCPYSAPPMAKMQLHKLSVCSFCRARRCLHWMKQFCPLFCGRRFCAPSSASSSSSSSPPPPYPFFVVCCIARTPSRLPPLMPSSTENIIRSSRPSLLMATRFIFFSFEALSAQYENLAWIVGYEPATTKNIGRLSHYANDSCVL